MQIRFSYGILAIILTAAAAGLVIVTLANEPDFLFRSEKYEEEELISERQEILREDQSFDTPEYEYIDPSLSENGKIYVSEKFGFSIGIPNKTLGWNGGCADKGQYGARAATLYEYPVPVVVQEMDDGIVITPEYGFGLDADGRCKKVMPTQYPSEAKTSEEWYVQDGWRILAKSVPTDADLDAWIKELYGSGCQLGELTPAFQPGVMNVGIKGDGKDLGDTDCPINYKIIFKYSETKKMAYTWAMGQDYRFVNDMYDPVAFDHQMLATFRID